MQLQPGMAINLLTGERQAVSGYPRWSRWQVLVILRVSSQRWNSVVPALKNVFRWPITALVAEQVDALTTSGQTLIMTEKMR